VSAAVALGVFGVVLLGAAQMSGPPLVVLLHPRAGSPAAFRATLAVVFAFTGIVAVALFAVGGQLSSKAAATWIAGLPGLALGWWLGDHAFHRVPAARFKLVVVSMLVASAVIAIAHVTA